MQPVAAVVFDMDGVLIDSEPLWQEAEIEVFAAVGVTLTPELCRQTMGLRIDEAVEHWYDRFPWDHRSTTAVAEAVVDRVVELVEERGEALPGVAEALAAAERRGLACALASSSPLELIEAVLRRLGLDGAFSAVHSADTEPYGKPHPGIYLTTAFQLGVAPTACLAIEDSINGIVAAKAARMAVAAVPDPALRGDPRLGIADVVLDDLTVLPDLLDRI